ncbi:MAG TPA: hypothetical protein VJP77_00135, partial [Planctomycetota bacterium]|nr:hypothetical protein [Planctomycetota bacterium]
PMLPGMVPPYWLRAALVGALFLVGAELALRGAGRFDPTELEDPYLGFPGTAPLYRARSDAYGRPLRVTSPNKLTKYRLLQFVEDKPANELRTFFLGGSSVYAGTLVDPDASMPRMLQLYLRAADPYVTPRVVNAGGAGMGSVQNLEVAREVLGYGADVLVLYPEGGEKNLIPPMPGGVLAVRDEQSPARVRARQLLAPLRVYIAVREAYQALLPASQTSALRSPFSAMVGYALSRPFGEETFTRLFELKWDRAPVLMPSVIPREEVDRANRRFERCLRETAELCRARGVEFVLVLPLHNLMSSFYLRFHIDPAELRPGAEAAWREAYERGLALKRAGDAEAALAVLLSIRDLYVEDRDDMLAFYVAQCWDELGRPELALEERLRIYERREMIRRIRKVAAEEGVPLVDCMPDLIAACGGRTPGYEFFQDSFHPQANLNQYVARGVAAVLAERGVVPAFPPGSPRLVDVEHVLAKLVEESPVPMYVPMLLAMERGDYEEAVRLGRTIDPQRLFLNTVEPFYVGWALTRAGRLDEARELHSEMLRRWQSELIELPDMTTDAGLVEHAFQGDVVAIF